MFNRSFLRRRKVSKLPQAFLQYSSIAAGDKFGSSVALSSDGSTAIVGSPNDTVSANANQGSATVFTRSGTTWTQQQNITESSGVAQDFFGYSIALSSNGDTAIIGAYGNSTNRGRATVFTRSGGVWTQQQTITNSSGVSNDKFGLSISLSSDGNTALVGGYNSTSGLSKATVFTRSGSVWTEQQEITSSARGSSVALSGDGNTAIVGMPYDEPNGRKFQGSATIFTRSGAVWTLQQTITKSDGAAGDYFGTSVALSNDGNTAISGTPLDEVYVGLGKTGSATVFTRSGGVWTQQQTIADSSNSVMQEFGNSVSLSSDGNTALVGAPYDLLGKGNATAFTRVNGEWKPDLAVNRSNAATTDTLGWSVALSSDGSTAIAGAIGIVTPGAGAGGAVVFYNH
jgi:hypothetical protein